ncbi:MAG: DNA repair protein RecO [Candidatus Buchananbacteria bacterium]
MTYLTQGIVLRRDNLSDNDRRYVIYTSGFGKINATIKGAKKITSKLNAHLDYFFVSTLMLAKGKSFERIASARIEQRFLSIASNIFKSSAAFYFCEAIDALIKYSLSDQKIFLILLSFFGQLEESKNKNEIVINLNKSIYQLLKCLGYQPLITARSQKQLFIDFNKLIQETAEKEIKSYQYLAKILA